MRVFIVSEPGECHSPFGLVDGPGANPEQRARRPHATACQETPERLACQLRLSRSQGCLDPSESFQAEKARADLRRKNETVIASA